jgi:flavin reductase like protein
MLGHDGDVGDESFDRLVGMLDLRPPRFLAGLSSNNHTCKVAARSKRLAVHVLSGRHIGLAHLFGVQTGDQVNKFDHSWHTGAEGKTLERIDLGDHIGYLLEPVTGDRRPRAGSRGLRPPPALGLVLVGPRETAALRE